MSPALPGALSAPLSQDRFQPVTVSLWAKVGHTLPDPHAIRLQNILTEEKGAVNPLWATDGEEAVGASLPPSALWAATSLVRGRFWRSQVWDLARG